MVVLTVLYTVLVLYAPSVPTVSTVICKFLQNVTTLTTTTTTKRTTIGTTTTFKLIDRDARGENKECDGEFKKYVLSARYCH